MSLSAAAVSYSVGSQHLLDGVSLSLQPGEIHAVLGANGAGKSTLLKLLAGELPPHGGRVSLDGETLQEIAPVRLARQRAVLPQSENLRFGFTAEQVVTLGRTPCLRHSPARERQIVTEALQLTDTAHLRARIYTTLSGGERARIQLARVLAQIWEPLADGERYLLLDEPTASLDLAHQHQCLRVARSFAARGCGVLAILHDPNLALNYADRITLLRSGQTLAQGTPAEVLVPQHLERAFGVKVQILHSQDRRHRFITVLT